MPAAPFTGSAVARRPAIMWAAQRATAIAWFAMAARWAAHTYLGAPLTVATTTAGTLWLALNTTNLGWAATLFAAALITAYTSRAPRIITTPAALGAIAWGLYLALWTRQGATVTALIVAASSLEFWASTVNPSISTWRKGWAFRRLWPARTAAADSGSNDMRASFGGGGISNFLQASKNLPRPVMNHPALGRPRFNPRDESVVFRVHPPGAPGAQTVADIESMVPSLIEGYNFVTDITVQTDTGQVGWLIVDFGDNGDALAEQVAADLDALGGAHIEPAPEPTTQMETRERHPTAAPPGNPDPFPDPPAARHRPHYHSRANRR